MGRQISITLGALADRLRDQIAAQGLTVDAKSLAAWQRDADAIVWLKVRGLLPESATYRAQSKLIREIVAGVKFDAERAADK